ncbi:MAG: hypothetical protein RLN90_10325 [Balneolaceae bacterium]
MIVAIGRIEKAIRHLSVMFGDHHAFWTDFQQNKETYFATLKIEQEYSSTRRKMTEDDFDKIAIGKSSVCYSILDAMSYLSSHSINKGDILILLKEIHIAFQCKDDIDDFRIDLNEGQHTYSHALTLTELSDIKISQKEFSHDLIHRYFYVSGIAKKILLKSISHFGRAKDIARIYGLGELVDYLDAEIQKTNSQIHEVNLLIQKTKEKGFLPDRRIPYHDTKASGISNSCKLSIDFIAEKISENNTLSDFITSAGSGENWITAYVSFMLSDHEKAKNLYTSLFNSDLFIHADKDKGSFNKKITRDADSLSFLIGALCKTGRDISPDLLNSWIDHQSESGGWRTYLKERKLRNQLHLEEDISMAGWLSPHPCVSASTCYILSLNDEWNKIYENTVSYLLSQLCMDGSIDSYWWTSPIYSTSWFILAVKDRKSLKNYHEKAIVWLLKNQSPKGFWKDNFSKKASPFYTALALKALIASDIDQYNSAIEKGIAFLIQNQYSDGGWDSDRKLTIPSTDSLTQKSVSKWRRSSFGVNVLVDDHQRVFTTSTVLSALFDYTKLK